MKSVKKHRSFSNNIKRNLSKTLRLSKKNKLKYFKDNRKTAKVGYTSLYQLGIKINNVNDFNKIQKKLLKLLLEEKSCNKVNKNSILCKIIKNSNWYDFGQCQEKKLCKFGIFYPENFEKPGFYKINHAIMERLFINPKVFRKECVLSLINILGEEEN